MRPETEATVAVAAGGRSDAAALARLHAACFVRGWDEESFRRYLGDPNCLVLLARRPGVSAPQGFLICRASGAEAEILTFAVASEMRGRRIGEALWLKARSELLSRGVDRVVLEVGEDNEVALALYRRLGFHEVGRRKDYYKRASGEPRQDGLIMACDLVANEALEWTAHAALPIRDSSGNSSGGVMPSATRPQSKLERLCAERGMRMTEQRRIIARVLSKADDHPDVEEVHRRVSSLDRRISLSTVYRTVRLFEDAGILERHEFGDGRARYEPVAKEHHDHLIDMDSGRVIEFRNEQIEKLQKLVAKELGYKLIDHRLELFGVPLDKDKA